MQKIGMAYQGENSKANNGKVWIGDDGPNKFTYTNKANVPVTLVLWVTPTGDYEAAFMNVRRAAVTYSMKPDESITLSLANGISGAWAYLFNEKTILSNGYVFESWGEYTTGAYATVDHSMLPNTKGNPQTITVKDTGCVSDSTRCYFACIDESVESCGYGKGEVKLVNCDPSSQPGANYGLFGGEPQGGCTGFSNGGEVDIVIGQ
ncbi:hypothetical protein F4780DRAFT_730939 [Xylariomycetidae sp. FL0641]|nr:hypothetical protein F4780DRAFT_730939 [Xylariomycetidae sp. FL0641]